MAAPAYVGGSAPGGASGSGITVSKPSGALDGHICLMCTYLENSGSISTVPSGWAEAMTGVSGINGYAQMRVYWKRLLSDPSSWAWAGPSTNWYYTVAAFSGCRASGSPFTIASIQPAPNFTNWPDMSGSTVDNDELLVLFPMGGWTGAVTYPAGFTPRLESTDLVSRLGTKPQSTAGPTGTLSSSHAGGNTDGGIALLSLRPVAAAGVSAQPGAAALALAGVIASVAASASGAALLRNFGRVGGHRG